jgi:hypothetical protein
VARPGRLRRRWRRPVPRWARRGALGLLLAAALGLAPAAALGPGGGAVVDRIDAYAPLTKGQQLVYRLSGSGLDGTVTLRVTDVRTVAGQLTASLQSQSTLSVGDATLPLGLGGSTIRVQSNAVVRTASGGSVRDLLAPLSPGSTWGDHRSGVVSVQSIDEQRTVLGPVSLSAAGRRFERCVAVRLAATTKVPGGQQFAGTGLLWYCPGVGLARAHLVAAGQPLDIVLQSVR